MPPPPSDPETVAVRSAGEADLPAIVAIYNATIPGGMVTADTAPVSLESRRPWFRAHAPARRPIWVAEDAAGAVCAWVSFSDFYGRPAYNPTAEISIYVAETHRRRGIGRMLLRRAVDHAPGLGIKTLLGFIWAHNEPSLRLFEAHGFIRAIRVIRGKALTMHPKKPLLRGFAAAAGFAVLACAVALADDAARMPPYGIVIHGGAGAIARAELTPELEAQYRAKLAEAVDAGYAVLDHEGSSLDAVVAAIRILEDSPLFNAGYGAVLNAAGECELDASIMDGRTLDAGAVAGVRHIKNPILLARDVMEKTPHVMLAGEGAEVFARGLGYELVPNGYFQTDRRRRQLEQARELERQAAPLPAGKAPVTFITIDENKFGTVGAVALDRQGNLAAGTSTGGMTNKKFGRVGDSPIIGAGTYAANPTCAVSCTGHGEYFIRLSAAHHVATLIEYRQLALEAAAADTIKRIGELGGTGGLIAIDRAGHVALPFNTPGMYRGLRLSGGRRTVAIFGAGE